MHFKIKLYVLSKSIEKNHKFVQLAILAVKYESCPLTISRSIFQLFHFIDPENVGQHSWFIIEYKTRSKICRLLKFSNQIMKNKLNVSVIKNENPFVFLLNFNHSSLFLFI